MADDGTDGGDELHEPIPPGCEDAWAERGVAHRAAVHVTDTFLDWYASFVTLFLVLVTLETLLLCVMAALAVAFYCRWFSDQGAPHDAVATCLVAPERTTRPARVMAQAIGLPLASTGRSFHSRLCFRSPSS
jgi:hypothetical protein